MLSGFWVLSEGPVARVWGGVNESTQPTSLSAHEPFEPKNYAV